MSNIHGESKLSFLEATGIVVGHGVGAGILAVPALAARNSLREILLRSSILPFLLHYTKKFGLVFYYFSWYNNKA